MLGQNINMRSRVHSPFRPKKVCILKKYHLAFVCTFFGALKMHFLFALNFKGVKFTFNAHTLLLCKPM